MEAVLDIEDRKASFVMELLDNFSFVKIKSFTNGNELLLQGKTEPKIKYEQRKQAMERLLNRHCVNHWTDEELDNIKYDYLSEKHLPLTHLLIY